MAKPYAELIVQVAALYNVRSDVLAAQVAIESGHRHDAFRYEATFYEHYIQDNTKALGYRYGPLAACSYGLLQILLETALELGYDERPELLFSPRIGLSWGAKYLRSLLDRYGEDYEKAIAAYNGGHGAVKDGKPYKTAAYVTRIEAALGHSLGGLD